MIIAIDGPSGAGKSSVAKDVATKLGFSCMDTGAMFRAIAWKATQDGIDYDDEEGLTNIVITDKISYEFEEGDPSYKKIFMNGIDITDEIRTPVINKAVTPVCKKEGVRENLKIQQRQIAETGNFVVDGRDIGTVIFPDAELKIFLTADVEERARRRFLQQGETEDIETVKADLERRDYEDSHRKIAPLKCADDAIVVDSTNMTQEEVVEKICKLAN